MADTNTNAQSLPDFDSFFRNMGKKDGYDPTDAEMALASQVLAPVLKKKLMQDLGLETPTNVSTYNTATNEVTGRVYEVGRNSRGEIMERVKPEFFQTTDGYQEYVGQGRTRDLFNENRGDTPKGYVAAGGGWGMGPQPTVGANNDAARAAAVGAQGQAASAQKPFTMRTAEGQTLTFSNAYDIRAAFMRGELTAPEADLAIKKSGFPLPR